MAAVSILLSLGAAVGFHNGGSITRCSTCQLATVGLSMRGPKALRAAPLAMALTEQEVSRAIAIVQRAINANAQVKAELGQLEQVAKVLGSGQQGPLIAVRFQGRFRRGSRAPVAFALPFGLGGQNKPPESKAQDGRGFGYASVAAKVDEKGKVVACFLEKDGGYGSRINVV